VAFAVAVAVADADTDCDTDSSDSAAAVAVVVAVVVAVAAAAVDVVVVVVDGVDVVGVVVVVIIVAAAVVVVSPPTLKTIGGNERWHCSQIRGAIVVSIFACHTEDPGSIPGRGGILELGPVDIDKQLPNTATQETCT
jgi:hypothetical protein